MALVSSVDLHIAWGRWNEVWGQEAALSWWVFLGDTFTFVAGAERWEVNDAVAERIRLINSFPHYHALLKAWAVQRASMEVTG